MTERLLVQDPSNPNLQVLKTWNLFRLRRYVDTVVYAQSILNSRQDYRILETMAEALFFLGKDDEALAAFTNILYRRRSMTTAGQVPIIM